MSKFFQSFRKNTSNILKDFKSKPEIEERDRFVIANQFFKGKDSSILAFSRFYGFSRNSAVKLVKVLGRKSDVKVEELASIYKDLLENKLVQSFTLNKKLQRRIYQKFKRESKRVGHRFVRRSKGYPISGQRTHTNSQTAKKKVWAFWLSRG
jgi:ribosomal protein S13